MCNMDYLPALLAQQQLQMVMLCTEGVFSAVVPCYSAVIAGVRLRISGCVPAN